MKQNPFETKVDSQEQDLYYADPSISEKEKDEFTSACFDAPKGFEATARAAFESRWGYSIASNSIASNSIASNSIASNSIASNSIASEPRGECIQVDQDWLTEQTTLTFSDGSMLQVNGTDVIERRKG